MHGNADPYFIPKIISSGR